MNFIKHTILIALCILGSTSCTGCFSERIQPGQVGKVLTASGWSPDTASAGLVTCYGRDKLVVLDATTHNVKEPLTVQMQGDLTLSFDIYVRARVSSEIPASLFDDIKIQWANDTVGDISFMAVYDVYGKMNTRSIARTVVSRYQVTEVKDNITKISADLFQDISDAIKGTPLTIEDVTLSGFKYPKVITEGYEQRAQQQIELLKIETKKQQDLAEIEANIAIEAKRREIELSKAATIRDYNRIIGESVTPGWQISRHFEVMEKMAESGNAVFMPYEAYRPDNAGLHIQMANAVETKE